MPIYEYRCEECGERFERLVPMREADQPAPCPRCGAGETRKQMSAFATLGLSGSSGSDAPACAPGGG